MGSKLKLKDEFLVPLDRIMGAVVNLRSVVNIFRYGWFINDLMRYRSMEGAEPLYFRNINPRLTERTSSSGPIDWHYFYQNIWAFKHINESAVSEHVDVGSSLDFVGYLTTITKVLFIDMRPFICSLENIESRKGTILQLPFESGSLQSLSTLSVIEHIGLGRYGDPLDPQGSVKAIREISRVMQKDGNVYLSLPIGKARTCFNAHRIHNPKYIVELFSSGFALKEFSVIDENGVMKNNAGLQEYDQTGYATGLYLFKKR